MKKLFTFVMLVAVFTTASFAQVEGVGLNTGAGVGTLNVTGDKVSFTSPTLNWEGTWDKSTKLTGVNQPLDAENFPLIRNRTVGMLWKWGDSILVEAEIIFLNAKEPYTVESGDLYAYYGLDDDGVPAAIVGTVESLVKNKYDESYSMVIKGPGTISLKAGFSSDVFKTAGFRPTDIGFILGNRVYVQGILFCHEGCGWKELTICLLPDDCTTELPISN